jgi:hypothetical protein
MRRFLLQPWDLLFYILNQSHIYSRIMWNENVVINMSGSVRKKAVSRQALAKQDSIRAEPKRAQWSKQEYTTEEIIKQCSLPQIVKWHRYLHSLLEWQWFHWFQSTVEKLYWSWCSEREDFALFLYHKAWSVLRNLLEVVYKS